MRKPRNANRGTTQAIEDQFCDLSIAAQERMLETLSGLHRQAVRMARVKPMTGPEAEAAGHAAYTEATNPAKNAALLLDMPEETKQ